jgi:hypothetical protein
MINDASFLQKHLKHQKFFFKIFGESIIQKKRKKIINRRIVRKIIKNLLQEEIFDEYNEDTQQFEKLLPNTQHTTW